MKAVVLAVLLSAAPAVAMDLRDIAKEAALRHDLDPALVAAVVHVESAWDPRAVSPKGALGLMQLMPATAAYLGVVDAFDPADNLEGGCRYLREMLDRFLDLRLALAAYNAGPDVVSRVGDVPTYPETREYVESILRTMASQPIRVRLARGPVPVTAVVSLSPSGSGIVLLLGGDR